MQIGWERYCDGFTKGDVAVFPALLGAWEVWSKTGGEWSPVKPAIRAASEGRRFHDDGRPEPYEFWTRTRDETIAEAMRMADEWAQAQKASAGS